MHYTRVLHHSLSLLLLLQGLDDQCGLGERGSDANFYEEICQKHRVRGVCQPETKASPTEPFDVYPLMCTLTI